MNRFDALWDQVTPVLHVDDAILDGEVIAADETGRPQFYDLIRRRTVPTCDLCRSASAESGCKRFCRRRLQSILPKGSPIVSEALSVTGRGYELFELMCSNDLEGIVANGAPAS